MSMIRSKEPPLDEVHSSFEILFQLLYYSQVTTSKQAAADAPDCPETSLGRGGVTRNSLTRIILPGILAPFVAWILFIILSSRPVTSPPWPSTKHSMATIPQSIFRSVTGAFIDSPGRDVTAGARILPELTSATTQIQPYRFDQQLLRWTARKPPVIPVPPEAVLTESATCWCFLGPTGHITLELLHPVYVNNITVSHSLTDHRSAPNNLVLWAIVPRANAESLLEVKAMSQLPTSLQKSQTMFPIAIGGFQFDVQKGGQNQTFELDSAFAKASMKVDRVLLQILSNWGASSTCLYGIRIHGS
jgi:hypothetical protein